MIINKISFTQIASFTTAGLFQLLTISLCANNLSVNESSRFMFLLSISSFFTFLDFGIFWSLLLQLSRNKHVPNSLVFKIYSKFLKLLVLQGCVLLGLHAFLYLPIDITLLIAAIILNNILFLGMVFLRGIHGEIPYYIIFNTSWPIAFVILKVLDYIGVIFHSYFVFIPILSSILINFVISCAMNFKFTLNKSNKSKDYLDSKFTMTEMNRISIYSTYSQILTLIVTYSDRFLIYPKLDPTDYIYYAIAVQFSGFILILIQNYSSSIIIDQISKKNDLKNIWVKAIPVIPAIGFFGAFLYLIIMPFIFRYFFPGIVIHKNLLVLVAINIFFSSILVHHYQKLWISNSLGQRIIFQLLGILAYFVFVQFGLKTQISLIQAAGALMLFNIGIIIYFGAKVKTKISTKK